MEKLQSTEDTMRSKKQTMNALEGFRTGLMHGERLHLPSAQRQHLERGSPLVGEVSYDARHRPLSTNISKHMKHMGTIVSGSDFGLHGMLPVKKPSGGGSAVLIATIEGESKLSLRTADGESRLSSFDLGHNVPVKHMSLSVNADHSYVLTGDASGQLHVTMAEPVMKNVSAADSKDDGADEKRPKKQLEIVANTTAKFSLPSSGDGRQITAVLAVDRGSQPIFLAGDSLGGVAFFFKNGTLRGRIKVTEDPGGVRGFRRGSGQTVLFFSSHSFGFLNVAQVDVSSAPCTGWNSPLFDVAADPQSTYSRAVLALEDGDVLVFSTTNGKDKDKACNLVLKFPRMSLVPFSLHTFRGHVMGLPTPLESTQKSDEYNSDLYFFNTAAMEAGYGAGQSRIVTLQASFQPRRLTSFALSGSSAGPKTHLALVFGGQSAALELYELFLKTPAIPKDVGGGSGNDWAAWLDWFPKVGILGITLVGVVMWNVRKVSGKNKADKGGAGGLPADFEAEMLRERLRKKKDGLKGDSKPGEDKLGGKAAGGINRSGPSSGSAGLDLGDDIDADMRSLNASSREMEELLASMGDD